MGNFLNPLFSSTLLPRFIYSIHGLPFSVATCDSSYLVAHVFTSAYQRHLGTEINSSVVSWFSKKTERSSSNSRICQGNHWSFGLMVVYCQGWGEAGNPKHLQNVWRFRAQQRMFNYVEGKHKQLQNNRIPFRSIHVIQILMEFWFIHLYLQQAHWPLESQIGVLAVDAKHTHFGGCCIPNRLLAGSVMM